MRRFALIPFVFACMAGAASAADYPDHPIRFIVPQAAGSATDNVARILAAVLGQELGQPVIVDDRPGGALTLGLDLVAKSAPDGYTIGMGPIGALAITRHMVAKLPYDIERDFQPIALVARGHLLLAVSPQLPVKSVAELIAYAKANPGKLTNASSSNGSPGHVGGELFKFMTGTQIVHVPYRGGAPAIHRSDRRPCRHDVREPAVDRAARARRQGARARGQRRQALAGVSRSADHRRSSVPGYLAPTWTGVIAPAGVPRPIVDKLNAAINKALVSEAFKEKFAKIGDEPAGGTPEDFAATIKTDSAKWGDVIKRAGIKFE